MRKIGHKIAKPFFLHFLHKPDFEGFSRPFHGVFTGFSWPFSSIGYLCGWDLARLRLAKYDLDKNHIEKTSVLKA